MKNSIGQLVSIVALALVAGCQTSQETGPFTAQVSPTAPYENSERFVLLDAATQHSVTCTGITERVLEDGRLEIIAQLRNLENVRIEVQVNCVFKDLNGTSVGDETPFQTVILTENATEQVKFVSASFLAKRYTIRVRQAR